MKLIIKEKNVTRINKVIEWLIYMIGYTLVLILVSSMFKSVYIDKDHFLIYAILIELVLYVLNKTLKPILFTITIPITGITLGLFYPFINLFIHFTKKILKNLKFIVKIKSAVTKRLKTNEYKKQRS